MTIGTLVVLPSLAAAIGPNGGLVVTRKFVEGMMSYWDRWDGRVEAVLDVANEPTNNLDNIEVLPGAYPFHLSAIPFGSEAMYDRLKTATVVLGGPHYKLHGMPRRLRAIGVVSVPCVEYSLRTRLDVIRHDTLPLPKAARRAVWEMREEVRTRRDIRDAHGVQCNGTPTFDAYSSVNDNCHLYFDTRTSEDNFATREHVDNRAARLRNGDPLRLAFSGRLIEMKGAHHLIPIARHLRELGVNYELTIYGGGSLTKDIMRQISLSGLQRHVKYAGVLDFSTELLPQLKENTDLLVLPHLQGDPSCTYLETLACGVPIAGYANEAWAGILERGSVGWCASIGNPERLAKLIAGISVGREGLIAASHRALSFARQHSFERTFDRRIEHLKLLAVNQF